jgi:hypothetical protein
MDGNQFRQGAEIGGEGFLRAVPEEDVSAGSSVHDSADAADGLRCGGWVVAAAGCERE